jgi:hypothetical protein
VGDVAGDRLGGASDGAVGDVSAADVVHGGGVGPVGVHGRVGVVGALRFSRSPTSVHRCWHGLVRVRVVPMRAPDARAVHPRGMRTWSEPVMARAVAPLSESASHDAETWVSSNWMPPAKRHKNNESAPSLQ